MSNKTRGFIVLIALAALDFAAPDDITTGVEPNHVTEWVALTLSRPIAWLVVRWLRRPER